MIEGKEDFDRMLKSLMAVMMASQVRRVRMIIDDTVEINSFSSACHVCCCYCNCLENQQNRRT